MNEQQNNVQQVQQNAVQQAQSNKPAHPISIISSAAQKANGYMSAMIKGGLVIPDNYSITNAVASATLKLQEVKGGRDSGYKTLDDGLCTEVSIVTALKSMLTKGEDIAQGHGYFLIRGNQLCYDESYLGCLHRVYRDTSVTQVNAQVIYEGDEFVYTSDNGEWRILKHESKLENLNKSIIGAYAVVMVGDKVKHTEIMTMDMIRKSWAMSKNTNGKIFTDYPDQMAKRTIIKRACKVILASESNLPHNEDEFSDIITNDVEEQARDAEQSAPLRDINEPAQVVDMETGENVEVTVVKQEQPQEQPKRTRQRNNPLV